MDLLAQFIKNIQLQHFFTKNEKILIAVSGGIDSVVLCKLCKLAGYSFGIAHCNFQLREENSNNDEKFVIQYGNELHAEVHTIKFDTQLYAQQNKIAIQEAARLLRYKWFEEVRLQHAYAYVLTAHHADDNIETLLMNIFRGTGMGGLTGIKEKNGKIIRPLLFARRKELELFLLKHELSFVQDETNFKNDYTRNFFRNTLLPKIAQVYPEVSNNLFQNLRRFKEIKTVYETGVAYYKKRLVKKQGNEYWISVLLLLQTEPVATILFEIVKDFGFSSAQVPAILALTKSESGKYINSATCKIIRHRKHLIITIQQNIELSSVIILEKEGVQQFSFGEISMRSLSITKKISNSATIAFLDESKITFPIFLRPWRKGDYFYPLGMQKKKKLSRFFIDRKLSIADKEKVWVLEMDKKIIWVIGHRIDDRFKITPNTNDIMRFEWKVNQ